MAIDKRFLYYTTEAGFLNDKNKGNIDNKSVAFISANGKRAIYTHGKFFSAEAFVVGTQIASTNAFTGTFNEADGLYDGLNIRYWLPYNGTSSAATLNLTINGTQTGAIPVYIKGTTRFTNHIGGTNVLDLTYRENVGGIEKGWWVLGSYGDSADGNTTYTFTSGESGSFKVKPSNGTEQEISVGKPETAGTADKVEKNLVIQINSGSEEYVSKYTYNGSSAKTLNIIQGSNINFGVEDGELIINGAYQNASTISNGLMSSDDKKKLNGISEGAEVNQNAFSKIKIGDTLIEADTKTDELTLEAGSNITLTPDTAGDKIIISAKDTTYTNATTSKDGLMSSEDKTKLDGIDEEANNYIHPSHTEYASGLYKIKIDEEGHVEAAVGVTKSDITALGIPAQDTDTHYESKNVVGSSTSSTTNTTSVLSNGNVYLNSIENGSVTSSHKISGSGNTTVKTDASGNIIVNSPTTIAWGSVTGKPSTFTPSDHDHTVSDITDFPETQELSVNGTAYDVYTSETSLPSFYAPSTLGSNGQVLKSDGSKLVWSSDKNDNTWRGIALTDGTTDTTVLGTGTNTGSLKFKAGNNVNLSADSGVITINSSYVDTDTTYSFASGTNGSFSVTPKNGSKQTVSIGKPSEAGIADEVSNPFTITVNSGTEEGTDKYTFTGADSKTLNITAGSNVTLTPSAGGLQISSSFTNTDTKAKVTTGTTTKSYLVGVNSSGYTSGNATDKFITDTGVYLDTTSGKLTATTLNATTLSGNLKGTIDSTTTATTPSAGDKSTKVATTAFVDTAISTALGSLADAMIFKGIVNSNTDLPASHEVGWTYRVGTKGTYAGATCEVGDLIICITAGTSASNAHWTIAQNNIDGAVTGPTSATDGNFALFSGSTGKIIKNSSYSPSSFTYTAGAGLSLSNNKFSIDSDLIEGTYGPEANVTGTDGITVVIPQIKVDENGLISEISEFTYTSKDTNTHYTTGLYVGASGAKSNAATSNGSTYIKLYDNDTSRASFKITGSGATTVKSDSSGNITITSSNDNTTYTLSGALDGDTFKSTLTPSSGSATTSIVPVFSGATSSAAGKAGLVPSPESSESSLYLKADGTWSKPTDTTYSAATTTAAGLMSAADKTKLDGIATGANKYVHPTYTSKSSGLYKITVNGTGHVSATASVSKADITALGIPGQDTTYDVMTGATSSVAGESGLVPAPEAGSEGLFLKGDGSWATPTNTTYSAMTASEATTGTATTARSITAKVLHDKITEMLPTVTQTATSGNEIGSVGGTKLYSPIQTTVSGNAGSATKLQTARTIDGVDFDGSSAITHYGTCSTAASTVAKTVSLTGFKLVTGSRIAIKFTVTNTAANPTLNVNSTGAKAIMYRGSAISAGYLAANRVYEFVYDGTDYELIGDINTNTTYNVATTSANGLMSSAMVTKLNGIADNADNVTFTQTLTSGTKIGSISINGTSTDIYCQTNTNTTYTAGTGLSLSSTKFSTSTGLYNESSATTAATAGWYRIATSSASIANCSATFRICGAVSGKHTVATIVAGTSYGIANSSSITVLHCSQYSTNALTKVRIVYHTSYSNNYAYLEVYNPNATALPISVKIIGGYGWSLVTPSTAGSIPSGYSSKEASLTDGTVYSEKFTGNGSGLTSLNASNISSGTIGSARLPDATTSAKGAMTTAMVTKLNGIATGATKVVESTVSGWGFTKNTGTVTSVTLTQGTGITVSSSGTAITTTGSRTITLNTAATDTIGGIKIGKDNSSYAVTAGTSSISADVTSGKYYAVEIDKNDKAFVYVPWTDTKNTSGSTNSSSKLFLIGATEQSANPTTYSHDTAYVGTDGHLYSDSKQVVNLSGTQALTNKTYNGYTLAAACAKGVATSVASGNTSLVTSGAVYTAIANSFAANDAMIFKGTLGTSGTVTALPAEHNVGWTYRVITAGTYAGKACEIGDLIICITDGTSANDAHWTVAQTNIDGAVVGPTSSTDGRVALFSGTSGKVLKQSSYTLGCSVPADAKFTDTVYTHPSNTQVSSGLYKITTNSTGHITAATAVVKADITALGIPGSNTTYGIGDYDTSGLIKPWKSYTKASTGPTAATSDTAVAVNGITTTSGRYYAVEMDSSGRAFVNVPWVDTNTNTDTKVNVTLATTSKAYLIGVTTAPTATAAAMTAVSDTGVYLDTTAGVLTATTFKGALSGNASSATYASNVRITATTSAGTYYPSWTSGTTSGTDYVLRGNSNFTYKIVAGTTSAQGYDTIYLGNSTASGTANNSAGRLLLYSSSTSYHTLVGDATTSTVAHTLPTTGGTILNTGTTSITAVQTSGAHIATLKINGADTKLYAPNNPSLGLGTEATNSTASTLIKSISVSGHTITVTKYNGTIGSTTKPAYFNAGVPTVCSTYAGGTKVTLNGTEKGASTASFYAPTAAGTEGYILVANSSGIPVWKDYGAINYKSGTVTKAITTSWAEFISNTNMATYCPASGTYVVQVYSSTIRYNSGIFSWNSAGTSDDEILLHRCGAGTNIYLKIVNGALHIAGASAVASGSINVKIKRLI